MLILVLGFVVARMIQVEDENSRNKTVEVVKNEDSELLMDDLSVDAFIQLAKSSDYRFVADGDYFSSLNTKIADGKTIQQWDELFLKGVNMGVALPDKFPSEFSATYDDYLSWFILLGKMNANSIRVYTILPPDFYKALAWYNVNYANRKLFLLQGVWAKEPPEDNYADPIYTREFMSEIKDAVDVIHGNAVIQPQHGHAHGIYAYDVSDYTIGIILGREWEPYAVTKTNKNDSVDIPYGIFIDVLNPSQMEKWLAGVMEFTVKYETQKYREQRPISFVNWLPLDPMYHNSEYIESDDIKEFDNDLESVDMEKFSATNFFRPGVFASYHVYPYYPDFIFQEKKYLTTLNHRGEPDNYYAYLTDLKKHQQGMPLVIAEYGVPSSRGNSHYTPFGFHQGGYSEKEQAEVSVLMTEDIHKSGCAGALYFEWIDEWFKNNWLVMDFEQPQERRKKWHNLENPEQNYGIMAVETRKIEIDGSSTDWNRSLSKHFIAADVDPAYFYLSGYFPEIDFNTHNLYIGIDTHDKKRGSFNLPFEYKTLPFGIEFLIEVIDRDNIRILVDQNYDIYTDRAKRIVPKYRTEKNYDGIFIEQFMLANRSRVDILGDTFPETKHNRGKLQFGNSGMPETSNADILWNEHGFLELRLTWPLLNVTDPSTRSVLDGNKLTGMIDIAETKQFNLFFVVTDKNLHKVNLYPTDEVMTFSWQKWEEPEFKFRLKPVYKALADVFKNLTPLRSEEIHGVNKNHDFSICDFYKGSNGAISFAFDGRCFSQYLNALPVLKKYNLFATFSKYEYAKITSGATQYRKMLDNEFARISSSNNEVRAAEPWIVNSANPELYVPPLKTKIPYVLLMNDSLPDIHAIFEILKKRSQMWSIFLVRHMYDLKSRDYQNLIHFSGKDVPNVSPMHFERVVRLCRNSNYWIAPVDKIARYIHIRENSKMNTTESGNKFFVTVVNSLGDEFREHSVSVLYQGPARIIKVTGSVDDGIYNVRGGKLYIDLIPNSQAIFEIIE